MPGVLPHQRSGLQAGLVWLWLPDVQATILDMLTQLCCFKCPLHKPVLGEASLSVGITGPTISAFSPGGQPCMNAPPHFASFTLSPGRAALCAGTTHLGSSTLSPSRAASHVCTGVPHYLYIFSEEGMQVPQHFPDSSLSSGGVALLHMQPSGCT